jgi:5-methylcytosine-specific restriction protein A
MMKITDLRPTKKYLIFDLASEAGFDVSDWISSAKNFNLRKANPKYCYEWSFVEPERVAIFNLWHREMQESGDDITYSGNFRADALEYRKPGKPTWVIAHLIE